MYFTIIALFEMDLTQDWLYEHNLKFKLVSLFLTLYFL